MTAAELNQEARAVLNATLIGVLATVNEDGSPWASPVHTVTDTDAVYWFSKETVQHSLNIDREPRVSLAVYSTDLSRGPKGVYLQGIAAKLDVDETTKARKLLEEKIGFLPKNFLDATGYRLEIGTDIRGKSTGNCWYFYS